MIHPTALIGDPPQHREYDGESFTPELHPSVKVGAYSCIDAGIERPTRIGARSWVLKQVHVGHDVVIGSDCEIATGTVIAGHCEIGDRVKIGVNATLKPFVKVGTGARIGAGAVVTRDVPPLETWVGNPARPIEYRTPVGIRPGTKFAA